MRVYLADLGHNQVTISSDVYPLGVANLATYPQAGFPADGRLEVSIYREPEDLKAAIDSQARDVLGVSSYSLNHNLSLPAALGKFTRTMFAQDLRRVVARPRTRSQVPTEAVA